MKKTVFALVMLVAALIAPTFAHAASTDAMQTVRDRARADKKQYVAETLALSDAEGKKFWPVYTAYQRDLDAVEARTAVLMKGYVEHGDQASSAYALQVYNETLAIDAERARILKVYGPRVRKALGPVKALRFLQLEEKIRAAADYDVAGQMPLVH